MFNPPVWNSSRRIGLPAPQRGQQRRAGAESSPLGVGSTALIFSTALQLIPRAAAGFIPTESLLTATHGQPTFLLLLSVPLGSHWGVQWLGGDRAGGLQVLCSIWPAQDVLKLELRVLLGHADTTRFLPLQLL